mgnify:CR=1 FL=1|tara:strand:+ start:2564 stop:2929 length:366 start_codon:yes stop_codon:yes gene_type:complete
MTFPTINFKFNGNEEAQKLADLVDQKFAALAKYVAHSGSTTCDVEFEKVTPQQSGDIYRMEANLMVDGTLYRAEATEASFEKAIDEMRDELDKALRRAKSKQDSLSKKFGRKLKGLLTRSG